MLWSKKQGMNDGDAQCDNGRVRRVKSKRGAPDACRYRLVVSFP